MRSVSTLYKTIRSQKNSKYEVRVVCGNTTYGMDKLKSCRIKQGLYGGDGPQIGGTYSDECDITLTEQSANWPRMAMFTVEVRVVSGDGLQASEWVLIGKYNTDERREDTYGNLYIVGFDDMLKLEQSWTDKLTSQQLPANWPITAKAAIDLIVLALGVQIDSRTVLDDTVAFIGLDTTSTARDVLADVAAGMGGNWKVTPEGKLRLIPLNSEYLTPGSGTIAGIAISGISVVGDDSLEINGTSRSPSGTWTETVDLSDYDPERIFINASGKWETGSNARVVSKFIPLPTGSKTITLTPNTYSYYALLTSNSHTAGDDADFATGFPERVRYETVQTINVPDDAMYLWVYTHTSATTGDIAPTSIVIAGGTPVYHDMVYLGKSVKSIDIGAPLGATTGVLLTAENGDEAGAGLTTGYVIKGNCNFSSTNVASLCLQNVQGYNYRPFSAGSTILDAAVEVGDVAIIDGHSYQIIKADWSVGPFVVADIEAPYEEEIDHEYTVKTEAAKTLEKVVTEDEVESLIQQTASQIRLEASEIVWVSNYSSMTADGTLTCQAGNIGGFTIGTDKMEVYMIAVTDSTTGIAHWQVMPKEAAIFVGEYVKFQIGGNTDTYTASQLGASAPAVINLTFHSRYGSEIIVFGVSPGDAAGVLIPHVYSDSVMFGNSFVASGNKANSIYNAGFYSQNFNLVTQLGNVDSIAGNVTASQGSMFATSFVQTSDAKEKDDIAYDYEKYEELFTKLKPADFKLKTGKSGRTHIGFVAQDVLSALEETGIDEQDFAPVVQFTPPGQEEKTWGIRYEEFISLNTHMIQKLMARVDELETRLAKLENNK